MKRAMNNKEKEMAALLKKAGFYIFYTENIRGITYWAKHTKLICQYELITSGSQAIEDLESLQPKQTQLKFI